MQNLPALSLTGSTKFIHVFCRVLVILALIVVLLLIFLPWQQFVRGSGKVIAFDPLDRRINVQAMVSGRIKKLHVAEGQLIKAGEIVAEIQDNDPNLLKNLGSQQTALKSRIGFAKSRVEALETQLAQQLLAKSQAINSADQAIAAASIAASTAELDHDRVIRLFSKGLVSKREKEQAILKRDSTAAELISAKAKRAKTENDFDAVLAASRGSQESARSDVASSERDLAALEISLSQNRRQTVTAPRDGIVLSIPVTDGSFLRPGENICVIIPQTESRFAEIWVDGNDVALIKARSEENGKITPGSDVRLAFEGWPTIQAAGWPQLAINTFGGEVIFVDATDDGTGTFRIVVGPKDDTVNRGDGKGPVKVGWPTGERWLRQGVRAKAWIMLEEVPLWYELWRQLNGFPALVEGMEDPTKGSAK